MLKNYVIVKDIANNWEYLFMVPKKVSLEVGEKVVCNTARGIDQLGVCCCDSFLAKPEVVCPLFETSPEKLRYVTGRVEYERFAEAMEEEEEEEDAGED